MVLLAIAACAACCTVMWLAVIVIGIERSASRSPQQPARARPGPDRPEDRMRPAVDLSGARIWVDEDDLFWHEIVCWPARRAAGAEDERYAG